MGGLSSGPPRFARTPQALRASSPCRGASGVALSGRCRNHPALAARGRARAARPKGLEGEKCIAETYETQTTPTPPVQCRPKAGEDGYHFGRARELVRPATTTLPDLPTAARKSRGGSITPVARAVSARFAQPPISPQGGPALRQTTPTDRPPKGVFLSGSLRDAFFCRHKRKRPLRKRLYYG